MTRIVIDLNNLTQDHLDECRPHLGVSRYRAPCIIGTLIPQEEREDSFFPQGAGINSASILDYLTVIPDQMDDLKALQSCFDNDDWSGVLKVAAKYIEGHVE
jgi:hypothetical protein